MKPIMITLLYLSFGGDIKQESFEIASGVSCESWFHHNVKVHETKKKVFMKNLYYHTYKDKRVIGYICGDEPPQ